MEGAMSNPVEALIVKWRLFASDLRDTTGYNKNYLCQRQVACLHQCADELASALASLRSSLDHVIPIADANTAHYVFSASPEVETLIAEMEQCLRDGRPSVNADRVRTWLASLRGAAEKPHAITRLKRDTWFDLNAPTDRTWPQGTRELCERAYQDGLAGRGAAEPVCADCGHRPSLLSGGAAEPEQPQCKHSYVQVDGYRISDATYGVLCADCGHQWRVTEIEIQAARGPAPPETKP